MVNNAGMRGLKGIYGYRAAAARIASWTLVSRVLGLVRDRLMFGEFGRGFESGAFLLAWMIPNLFRRLFGEGALVASFVPVLTRRMEREGTDGARRTFGKVFGAILILLVGLTLLGWVLVALLPEELLAEGGLPDHGEEYAGLLRPLLYILLPYVLPICLMALAAAAQNVTGRFALPSMAPVVLNLFWIGGVLYVSGMEASLAERALALAGFLVVGGLFQLLLQLPGLKASGLLARPRLDLADPDLREVGAGMVPMVLGLSIAQLNVLMTYLIAAFLVPKVGANGILFLANRLLDFPHALLGVAFGTAVFPLLSLLGERGEREELECTFDRALAFSLFLALPAAVGLFVLAAPLVEVLFVHGRFTAEDGVETTKVVKTFAFALPGLVGVQVLARAHYAVGNRTTPVRISVGLFFASVIVSALVAPTLGTFGLALVSVASALLNSSLLFWSIRMRMGWKGTGVLPRSMLSTLLASIPTGLAAWGALHWAREAFGPGKTGFFLGFAVYLLFPSLVGLLAFFLSIQLVGGEVGRGLLSFRRHKPNQDEPQ